MKTYLYTVYDRVAEEGGPVFQSKNEGTAIRAYKQLLQGSPAPAHEYSLVCLGEYENDPAKIVAYDTPYTVQLPVDPEVKNE